MGSSGLWAAAVGKRAPCIREQHTRGGVLMDAHGCPQGLCPTPPHPPPRWTFLLLSFELREQDCSHLPLLFEGG